MPGPKDGGHIVYAKFTDPTNFPAGAVKNVILDCPLVDGQTHEIEGKNINNMQLSNLMVVREPSGMSLMPFDSVMY